MIKKCNATVYNADGPAACGKPATKRLRFTQVPSGRIATSFFCDEHAAQAEECNGYVDTTNMQNEGAA